MADPAAANSGVAQPAAANSSVAQPAELQLIELNKRSASLSSWKIGIYRPRIEEWSYQEKATGNPKKGAAFRCLVVSASNPSQYAVGQIVMRGSMAPLEAAQKRFPENKHFRLSRVQFQANAQQEFIHTPLKLLVQLGRSSLDPLLSQEDGQVVQPEPGMTLSDIKGLRQHQRFDVTALVSEVGETRNATTERQVTDIRIIDQSAPDSKVQEIKWSYWTNLIETQQESATMQILREAAGSGEALSFFALDGKSTRGKDFSVENSKDFFVVKARGTRAVELAKAATGLHAVPIEEREVLQQHFEPKYRNFDGFPGTQSFCKILRSMVQKTNIGSIDDESTLWQLVWTEVSWPQGDISDLCTKQGDRLFPEIYIMDATGPGPRVRMTEESVLALAQVSSKEEFLQIHAAGKQTFPAMACLKILREVNKKRSGGAHLAVSQTDNAEDQQAHVNFTIVQASDQPFNETPTKSMLELIPMLPHIENDTACILCSPLRMVKACIHYAFQVCLPNGDVMPCQKILTLVKSTKASQLQNLGQGYKLVTHDIEDVLGVLGSDVAHLASQGPTKFVLSSTCTLENLQAYRLDPPRGGSQHALVTITGKADDVFVVELVQLLTQEEAAQARISLLKLMRLAIEINSSSTKRGLPWSDDVSPVKAKKCKSLGRCPTADPLEEPFL